MEYNTDSLIVNTNFRGGLIKQVQSSIIMGMHVAAIQEVIKMLRRRRLQRKLLSWSLGLTALGIFYVCAVDNRINPKKKEEANRITSPWDISNAPKAFLSQKSIKVKPLLYQPSFTLRGHASKRHSIRHMRHRSPQTGNEQAKLP